LVQKCKVTHGNGIVGTISINKKLGAKTRRPQVFTYYDLLEGLTNEKEDLIFETKPKLFSINTIIISDETISLLNVGVSKIRINGEFELEQGIQNHRITKGMASIINKTKFNVILEVSLEDKVYPETYYHHSQVDIEGDETLAKF
jgi:hypothetical protein